MNFLKYLKETLIELKEVVFPSTTQTISYTILVVIISILIALFLSGVDLGLREGLTRLITK